MFVFLCEADCLIQRVVGGFPFSRGRLNFRLVAVGVIGGNKGRLRTLGDIRVLIEPVGNVCGGKGIRSLP